MAQLSSQLFNPCLLDENEQIPTKIWELLRRNKSFREAVCRLTQLDDRATKSLKNIQAFLARNVEQGQNTQEARELVAECERRNKLTFRAKRMLEHRKQRHRAA